MIRTLWEVPPPTAAVEIAARHVSAATVELRGGRPAIAAQAIESLPEGALTPSLTAQNAHDGAIVAAALGRVLERVGRPRRIGLIVPDAAAKVSLVKFEQVPPRAADLDQLIRWQIRKTAPFPLEEAQLAYVPSERSAAGQEFVVTLARTSVIREYEALCAAAGTEAGLVDISSFNVINAALASGGTPAGDWLLVNVAWDFASVAILRGEHLMFFRTRGADADGTLADLVHQSAMYYEDRLAGQRFTRVLLSGASSAGDGDQIRRSLEERLDMAVEPVNALGAVSLTDRIVAAPALLDTLAPLVGLLLRGTEATA